MFYVVVWEDICLAMRTVGYVGGGEGIKDCRAAREVDRKLES